LAQGDLCRDVPDGHLGPSAFQRRLTAQKTLIASDIAGTLSRQARRAFLELAATVADSFSSIRAAARY
jgi:hypothetical protein